VTLNPNDGILSPQEIDSELLALPAVAHRREQTAPKKSEEIYMSIRPLMFTLPFLETNNLSSEATSTFWTEIVKLQETLAINFHAAEGLRIERRIASLSPSSDATRWLTHVKRWTALWKATPSRSDQSSANYVTQWPRSGNTIDTLVMCTKHDNLEVILSEAEDGKRQWRIHQIQSC
jgi:hypothetical protein